jgi:Uma2 family endonuclease
MSEQQMLGEHVVAHEVSFEDYMRDYAEDHTEWEEAMVIKLSPVSSKHDDLTGFLYVLLRYFAEETGIIGVIRREPFVMRCKNGMPARQPDLQIIRKERAAIVKDTMTDGPTDVVIEVVSPESVARDKDKKFKEYQRGGVQECWIFDPVIAETRFFHLNARGVYEPIPLENGIFRSRALSPFQLEVALLWREALPTTKHIVSMVEAMLK